MPGTFTYTESTNTIQVTDGTSGAPATFNDMYTADQAGTGTVLNVAENGAAAVTLDYQIRPTHDRALLITCVVTAKTAEADYIFITGTDAWDVAQTESLDVTAGNGSYTTTKRFRTITNLDCSDNAAGGGAVWADGQIAVTQPIWGVVWEYVADGQYKIEANVAFGDSSTSTYFLTQDEQLYFSDGCTINIKTAGTLTSGDLDNSYGLNGSAWSLGGIGGIWHIITSGQTGTFNFYSSLFNNRDSGTKIGLYGGTFNATNSIISNSGGSLNSLILLSVAATLTDVYHARGMLELRAIPTINDYHAHKDAYGVASYTTGITLSTSQLTSNPTASALVTGISDLTLKDPTETVATPLITHADGWLIEQYTCNIHVTDKEGNNLSGVTVKCVETGGTTEFSVSTAADGTISEQTIDYKKWEGTSETLTDYSPHEFTFTKAGFEPCIIKNVTVDEPISWEVKLDGATGAWEKSWR